MGGYCMLFSIGIGAKLLLHLHRRLRRREAARFPSVSFISSASTPPVLETFPLLNALYSMPPKSDSSEGIILNFLNEQNRPLNVQNVADALQKYGIKKATAQKVLDSLADSGQISFKEYGKQKIYLARQDRFQIPNQKELQDLKCDNEKLKKEVESAKAAVAGLEAEIRILESNLTLEQIREKEKKLRIDVECAEDKLRTFKQGTVLVDAEEREKLQQTFVGRISEWKKRKKAFRELWDLITEALPKDLKEFKDELGIEFDEDVNVNLQEYANLCAKKQRK